MSFRRKKAFFNMGGTMVRKCTIKWKDTVRMFPKSSSSKWPSLFDRNKCTTMHYQYKLMKLVCLTIKLMISRLGRNTATLSWLAKSENQSRTIDMSTKKLLSLRGTFVPPRTFPNKQKSIQIDMLYLIYFSIWVP